MPTLKGAQSGFTTQLSALTLSFEHPYGTNAFFIPTLVDHMDEILQLQCNPRVIKKGI